ncbi:MAG: selenocysteine-specific translation elongation factor [Burkholderiales bacterium]|nr:selenocysteine-specific translation elongation factor [Burkholderiales bacterium]MDE1926208.1 selenocysteine-specific translation elongation factor [Burkholderiales bacterium]MDE2157978.1 selenocysteine-specific translation elongation factor [Burkholderiales bacterium]MDE2502840.1 selenocysteine-specific translation elongation factor [Burkholderiales bacterium]
MMVATAGHVDHGKTSLVKQLTGVNTDRLEEEQRRGMTIALGWAYRKTAAGNSVGFVDVPGHRRFINTMISGVRGVDLAMLVVDAGEGVMPQTLEHARVMDLLGVQDILAVITKTDRVAPEQVRALAATLGGLLPAAPVFLVSSLSGSGIAALTGELEARAAAHRAAAVRGHFRLSIDRAFVLKGAGLIVTGTAMAGRVAVGDTLRLHAAKAGIEGIKVRVRGLHVQDEAASTGQAGQRCALNLVGDVDREEIQRGDMLADPRCVAPSLRLDARLRLLDDLPFPLKQLQPVKLYLGARRLAAKVYFLEPQTPSSERCRSVGGPERLVQFLLKEPLQVCWGDRFLIQDDSESVVLGGGTVLSPHAPQWHKRQASRLGRLRALNRSEPAEILCHCSQPGLPPVNLREFGAALNLQDVEIDEVLESPLLLGRVRVRQDAGDWLLNQDDWITQRERLYRQVVDWHAQHPMDTGMPHTELLRACNGIGGDCAPNMAAVALDALVQEKRLHLAGGRVRCADHRPATSPAIQAAWERLQVFLTRGGFRIPLLSEIERELQLGPNVQTTVIALALQSGNLRQISPKRVALPEVLRGLAAEIGLLAARQDFFTVIEVKTHLNLGRDLTIEILEFFDRIQFTQRQGGTRRIRDAAAIKRILT